MSIEDEIYTFLEKHEASDRAFERLEAADIAAKAGIYRDLLAAAQKLGHGLPPVFEPDEELLASGRENEITQAPNFIAAMDEGLDDDEVDQYFAIESLILAKQHALEAERWNGIWSEEILEWRSKAIATVFGCDVMSVEQKSAFVELTNTFLGDQVEPFTLPDGIDTAAAQQNFYHQVQEQEITRSCNQALEHSLIKIMEQVLPQETGIGYHDDFGRAVRDIVMLAKGSLERAEMSEALRAHFIAEIRKTMSLNVYQAELLIRKTAATLKHSGWKKP